MKMPPNVVKEAIEAVDMLIREKEIEILRTRLKRLQP